MKVEKVDVRVLRVAPEKAYQAGGKTVDAYWHVLAEVTTTDGARGFGYVVALNGAMVSALASATRELSQSLVGVHVLEPEAAWERLYNKGKWIGPGGLLHYAISPLDIALWDAAGRSVGQPLYRMLGGYRDRLPVYASDGFWYSLSPEELGANAARCAREGFTAVKLRIGHEKDPAREVARVRAVREAAPGVAVLVDATETWDLASAMKTGEALQDAGVHWLEDPTDHQDVGGYARLSAQLRVPIATGEHLYKLGDFARLFEARGTSVALIDLGRIGGITPWRKVAALADACGLRVCGHVLPEVHVHLACAIPNGYLVEYVPRSAAILKAMPEMKQGHLIAPEAPGLGLELDRQAVERFTT